MPVLTLTANDRYYLGPVLKSLRRVLNVHGHCANKADEACDGDRHDKASACEFVRKELADTQADRSDLVLLLHALEDAEREPVARPPAYVPGFCNACKLPCVVLTPVGE